MNRKVPLVRGFDDYFMPHSSIHGSPCRRYRKIPDLTILAESDEAGVFLAIADEGRRILSWDIRNMTVSHLIRNTNVIKQRDCRSISRSTIIRWWYEKAEVGVAFTWNILYSNWLNYYVYQTTPYEFIDTAEILASRLILPGFQKIIKLYKMIQIRQLGAYYDIRLSDMPYFRLFVRYIVQDSYNYRICFICE